MKQELKETAIIVSVVVISLLAVRGLYIITVGGFDYYEDRDKVLRVGENIPFPTFYCTEGYHADFIRLSGTCVDNAGRTLSSCGDAFGCIPNN